MHLEADIRAISAKVGWLPRVPLEAGLEATVQWFQHVKRTSCRVAARSGTRASVPSCGGEQLGRDLQILRDGESLLRLFSTKDLTREIWCDVGALFGANHDCYR